MLLPHMVVSSPFPAQRNAIRNTRVTIILSVRQLNKAKAVRKSPPVFQKGRFLILKLIVFKGSRSPPLPFGTLFNIRFISLPIP